MLPLGDSTEPPEPALDPPQNTFHSLFVKRYRYFITKWGGGGGHAQRPKPVPGLKKVHLPPSLNFNDVLCADGRTAIIVFASTFCQGYYTGIKNKMQNTL